MASRYEVEVKVSSARGLKNVNWRHGANRPYAVVWVDPKNKCATRVDESGDTEANWDHTLLIPVPVGPIEDFTLYIDVVHAGSEEDTKPLIGSARLKLADVGIDDRASRTLALKRPSGRPQGKVDVKVTVKDNSYRAPGGYYAPPYGVPPPAAAPRDYAAAPPAYGYPQGSVYSAAPPSGFNAPPQPSYAAAPPSGYNAPPQASYTAAPPSGYPYSGYNAAAQTAPYGAGSYGNAAAGAAPVEKKKSKFGGMGTGLAVGALAGAVGGIALLEGVEHMEHKIADRVAEKVEDDLGYDDYYGDDF